MSGTDTPTRHDETIIGNLARDPELRYTRSGLAVANLTVAVDPPERGGETTFRRVTVWRDLAENAVLSLSKGDRVIVSGWVGTDTWTDRDGQAHAEDVLVARAVGPDLRFVTADIAHPQRRSVEPEPVLEVEPVADDEADEDEEEEGLVQGQGF